MSQISAIPAVPGAVAGLGHVPRIVRDPLGFLKAVGSYGDLLRLRLGPFNAVMVCDPDLFSQVLRNDRVFDRGGPVFDSMRRVTGNGVATCLHADHRRRRRLVQPAFNRNRVAGYADTMIGNAVDLSGTWSDGQIVEMNDVLCSLTTQTLLKTMFGSALTTAEAERMAHSVATVLGGLFWQAFMPSGLRPLLAVGNSHYHSAHARLRQACNEIIAQRRADGADHGDLLSAVLAARSETGDSLSDAEVFDEIMTVLVGGTDSVASTLMWALYLLARHPEVQTRLQAEVDSVLAGGPLRAEHLPRLELAEAVVTETLRMYPTGWLFTRTTVQDTMLRGYLIPEGTAIVLSPLVIHFRGDLYDNPDRFDPDRWLNETRPPRETYVPFGVGPRVCLGAQYGPAEATLTLAAIASRWHLALLPHRRIRPAAAIALRPRQLPIRVTSRATSPHQTS